MIITLSKFKSSRLHSREILTHFLFQVVRRLDLVFGELFVVVHVDWKKHVVRRKEKPNCTKSAGGPW